MTQPDPSAELDALQTLLANLRSEAAQEALKPTGFPFQLPDGTIAFDKAQSIEAIFREISEAGKMNVDEFICFRLLRTRFQHECELLLLHIMARQGIYSLPDDQLAATQAGDEAT
jgi:hypothetical protein